MREKERFGEIVRRLRQAAGLTQEELAYRARLNVSYLSDLERDRSMPTLAVIIDLANSLDTTPSEMLKTLKTDGKAPIRKRPGG